jgi:hypothetical protein
MMLGKVMVFVAKTTYLIQTLFPDPGGFTMRLSKFFWITALASITATACSDSKSNDNVSKISSESAFDPKPDNTTSIEAQLKRFKGQTEFLSPDESNWGGIFARAASAEGGSRSIQESDIFKIGNEGSKLLYLLNNYRGLQVVSYADGPDAPKLVGRAAATGNYPDDMYFDSQSKRILVLENVYASADSEYYSYSTEQSRLLAYNVNDNANPFISQTLNLEGSIRESRIVGNVLYVATTVRPSYDQNQNTSKGLIYSFNISGNELQQVDVVTLSAPVAFGETMNIVETKIGNELKYYLVAVLADYSNWSWFAKSPIEVIDISDVNGDIKPLMVVESKGDVSERSQTTIQNGSLIVTSNFNNASNLLRIAVESFVLPTADSKVIDSFEADFRKISIERLVRKKKAELATQNLNPQDIEDQVAAFKIDIETNGDYAIKGIFVSKADAGTSLSKLAADDTITFGSTQGLSARLQDVRYEGNLLYAFWVPANNIDPLDVIDISKPSTLKHLSHLEFDGWIQRAIPVTYKGKHYIIGLGWVIPSVNNDAMRRYPQAMLFEVIAEEGKPLVTKVISQKNLSSSSVWANFDTSDKNIEFRMTSESNGMLLYPFSSWTANSYTSGGQMIGIDLAKIDTDAANVFNPGSILKGDESWLRRIFSNPEIDRINTFTDMSLATFDPNGQTDQFVEATNILELARNLVGYLTFEKNGKALGIQVVSNDNWWTRDETSTSSLRIVNAATADAEKAQVLATIEIPGTYVDSMIERGNRLLVLTKTWNRTTDNWTQEAKLVEIDLNQNPESMTITSTAELGTAESMEYYGGEQLKNILRLKDGTLVVTFDGKGFLVGQSAGSSISVTNINAERCKPSTAINAHFHQFDGRLWTHYVEKVEDQARANYSFHRHFIAEVSTDGSTCSVPVNVPGLPRAIGSNGLIVTQDERVIDIVEHDRGENSWYETKTEKVLSSLRLLPADRKATLVDLFDAEDSEISSLQTLPNGQLLFVESTQKPDYWFHSSARGGMWPDHRPVSGQENRLAILGADEEFNFTKRSYALNLSSILHATAVATKAVGDNVLIVTKQGSSYTLWQLDNNWVLTKLKLKAIGATESADKAVVPGWYYSSNGEQINVNSAGSSLEIVSGYFGVYQFTIVR